MNLPCVLNRITLVSNVSVYGTFSINNRVDGVNRIVVN